VGALSFRSGEVLREVRGLCPAAGEDAVAASVEEDDFLSVEADPTDDAPDDEGDLLASFFVPFVLAPLLAGSAVSAWPLSDRKSAILPVLLLVVWLWVRYSMLQLGGHPIMRDEIGLYRHHAASMVGEMRRQCCS